MRNIFIGIFFIQSIYYFWSFSTGHSHIQMRDILHEQFLFGMIYLATAIGILKYAVWGRWLAIGSALYNLIGLAPFILQPATGSIMAYLLAALIGASPLLFMKYFLLGTYAMGLCQLLVLWSFFQNEEADRYAKLDSFAGDSIADRMIARKDWVIPIVLFAFLGVTRFKIFKEGLGFVDPAVEAKARSQMIKMGADFEARKERAELRKEKKQLEFQKKNEAINQALAEASQTKVRKINFTPDERSVVLEVWEKRNYKIASSILSLVNGQMTLRTPPRPIEPSLVSDDGRFAVTVDLKTILNLETGLEEPIAALPPQPAVVISVQAQPPAFLIYDAFKKTLLLRNLKDEGVIWSHSVSADTSKAKAFQFSPSKFFIFINNDWEPALIDIRNKKVNQIKLGVSGKLVETSFDEGESALIISVQKSDKSLQSFIYTIANQQLAPLPFSAQQTFFSIKDDILTNIEQNKFQVRKPSANYSLVWEKDLNLIDYIKPKNSNLVLIARRDSKQVEVLDLQTQLTKGIGNTFEKISSNRAEIFFKSAPSGNLIAHSQDSIVQVFWKQELPKPQPALLKVNLPAIK